MTAGTAAGISIRPINDGVFFTDPGPLPRGRHSLSREAIVEAQRERLMIAATEILAAHGYRGVGPGAIASRAGVSLAAFYDCFDHKDTCLYAAYDRFIDVLLARMAAVETDGRSQPEIVRDLLSVYLGTLDADQVVARAYQVEMDALGFKARERRRNALNLFAAYIREISERIDAGSDLDETAYIGVVYALRQIAADALDTEPEPDLAALNEALQTWISDLFRQR